MFLFVTRFTKHGHMSKNNKAYQKLDTQITNMALAAARRVMKRKHGYTRNDEII